MQLFFTSINFSNCFYFLYDTIIFTTSFQGKLSFVHSSCLSVIHLLIFPFFLRSFYGHYRGNQGIIWAIQGDCGRNGGRHCGLLGSVGCSVEFNTVSVGINEAQQGSIRLFGFQQESVLCQWGSVELSRDQWG